MATPWDNIGGLLSSLNPNADDQAQAKKMGLLALGLSLLGARKGQEWDAAGRAGMNGIGAYQGTLASGPRLRQENLKTAMELQKFSNDQKMQDMAFKLIGGGGASAPAPEQAGPPSPSGASATYAPPQQPGQGMAYSPAAEQGWAILNPKVAEVLHRQQQITQGPQGTLLRNGQIVGQVTPTGIVDAAGKFTPLPPDALQANAAQEGAVAGARTAATEAAQQPYRTTTAPVGPNGAPVFGYVNSIAGQPNVGGQAPAADPLATIVPRTEKEAAQLGNLMASRGQQFQMTRGQDGTFVPGPNHGKPFAQGNGVAVGADPLQIKQAEQNIATQGTQDTEIAKSQGQDFVGIVQAEKNAPANIAKLDLLKNYLSKVDTGKAAPTVMTLKAYAAYFAPDLAKEWTKDVPYAQAAASLSNEMALQLRSPQGGAGMPGALSNSDREFLTSMSASSANDPRAIPLMIDARIAMEKRSQEVGKLAREYRQRNGKIDDGFYSVLAQYSAAHPLFQGMQAPTAAPAPTAGSGWKIERVN